MNKSEEIAIQEEIEKLAFIVQKVDSVLEARKIQKQAAVFQNKSNEAIHNITNILEAIFWMTQENVASSFMNPDIENPTNMGS